MRAPSAKTLMQSLGIDAKRANLIRRIARVTDSGLATVVAKHCPKTQSYVDGLYNSPYDTHMWRVTVALHAINEIVDGYGVEALGPAGSRSEGYAPPYEYINMGDTYATTLIYRRKTDTLRVGTWGDLAEKHPNW